MTIVIEQKNGQKIDVTSLGFSGGERHVQLSSGIALEEKYVFIHARIGSADELLDLILTVNALRHRYGQDLVVDMEIPYLPYARQDRVCAEGQAFSLEVMAQFIALMKLNKLVVWDCHSSVGIDLTSAINIPAAELIKANPGLVQLLQDKETILVCPDKGALARCQDIQESIGINEMIRCEKCRDPGTGKITHTEILADNIGGKVAVIVDDICDGGRTFIEIAKQLKSKKVKKIVLYVTHGIFSKGLGVFDGLIDEVYSTNSVKPDSGCTDIIDVNYRYKK